MKIVKTKENPARYLVGKDIRLTLYSASLVRAEFSKEGIFEDDRPLIIESSFKEKVPHKIIIRKKSIFMTTDCFELKILPDGRPFDVGNFWFTVFKDKKRTIWEPGIEDPQNLGGALSDLYKYPEGKLNERFSQGLISRNGYFVYRNHCEMLWDEKNKWVRKKKDWESKDWYLFGYGENYRKAFSDFVNLFGRIPIPPKWTLGYWYSKWYPFKDQDILDVVKKIKENDIPLDVFVIDTDWRKHTWNGYEWNKKYFPNPNKFIQELKKFKLHCCLNDHPGYGSSDELPTDDPYKEKIILRIPEIKEFRVRWSDQRYVSAWTEEVFAKILKEGIDFWWVDGNGATDGISDFSAQTWTNRFYFESARMAGDGRRPMILSRWGGIGSHKYPVQFSGDTYSSFETLKYQIAFTHRGGNVGAAYWSHDIGGFLGKNLPPELFVRWLQFGCFSPILRTHSSGGEREVWNFSKEILESFKKYLKIRYALFPYFYTFARECFDTGLPIIRGLYLEYPKDQNAYRYDEEYLIGTSVLVAPIYEPGDPCEREIYFPAGSWIALEGKEIVKGPCTKRFKVPLNKIPVFIRKGAIIPTKPFRENLNEEISEIEWNIFPDKKSEFIYYEDDGVTEKYRDGIYLSQKIIVAKSSKETKIVVEPVQGNYKGFREKVAFKFNVFIERVGKYSVTVNGQEVSSGMTKKIFSNRVDSSFNFLSFHLESVQRTQTTEIRIG